MARKKAQNSDEQNRVASTPPMKETQQAAPAGETQTAPQGARPPAKSPAKNAKTKKPMPNAAPAAAAPAPTPTNAAPPDAGSAAAAPQSATTRAKPANKARQKKAGPPAKATATANPTTEASTAEPAANAPGVPAADPGIPMADPANSAANPATQGNPAAPAPSDANPKARKPKKDRKKDPATAASSPTQKPATHRGRFQKKNIWLLSFAAVLLLLCLGAAVVLGQPGLWPTPDSSLPAGRSVTVVANGEAADGIAPNATFTLTYQDPDDVPDKEDVRAAISFQPAIPFSLHETAPGVFQINPLQKLEIGISLVITAEGQDFSFVVQNQLVITSVLPVDGALSVPVHTGVEFTFSTRDMPVASFEDAFSITPAVAGSFTKADGRYIFYPESELAYGTKYTITLDAGLTSSSGSTLGTTYSGTFTTVSEVEVESSSNLQVAGNRLNFNSLACESAVIPVYYGNGIPTDTPVDIMVYAFESFEEYKEQLLLYLTPEYGDVEGAQLDVDTMRQEAAFQAQPIAQGGEYHSGLLYLVFPETLPEGWYAVQMQLHFNGHIYTRQVLLQVSDLSVFYMLSEEDLVFWINDAANGQPVQGASVHILGEMAAGGTTDATGVAKMTATDMPENDDDYYYSYTSFKSVLTIQAGGRQFADISMGSYYNAEPTASELYFSYLYCDRPVYQRTDTVQVFGAVRPRNAGTAAPAKATLRLGSYYYDPEHDKTYSEQTVTISPNGTFTAQIPLEALSDEYPSVALFVGNDLLYSTTVHVYDFEKPAVTGEVGSDAVVYLAQGETPITLQVQVSMFDGTPASSMAMELDGYDGLAPTSSSRLVTTDQNGQASLQVQPTGDENTWRPTSYQYNFSNTDAQAQSITLYGQVYVIHRDVMLQYDVSEQNGKNLLTVTTNAVDISNITDAQQLWDPQNLTGAVVGAKVQAQVYKVVYEAVKTGTLYDPVTRQMRECYKWERRVTLEDSYTFTTENGRHVLADLPVSNSDASYFVNLSTTDSLGRAVLEEDIYLGGNYSRYYGDDDGTLRYGLENLAPTDEDESSYYYYYGGRFSDGETVRFALTENDVILPDAGGRILYGVAQNGFSRTGVSKNGQVTLPFNESLVPNYTLAGAYFDGKHVFALEQTNMYFNPSTRDLAISLTPGKAAYSPGQTASIAVKVTNKATGKPAANTTVLLSMVDEAVFAVEEQYINFLTSWYKSVYFSEVFTYTSYDVYAYNGNGGEKGGGGGYGEVRSDFKDTAYFATVTTDAYGNATFTVKLPDNITSWRLTTLALDAKNQAGHDAAARLVVTKDFFLTPVVNSSILAGDSFVVGLRGAGRAVLDTDTVAYSVQLTGPEVNKSIEASGNLRDYTTADFGALAPGRYTVTLSAECGGYTDAMQLPFEVISSGVQVATVQTFNLADGLDVDPLRWPVNVLLYGEGAKTYNQVLRDVHGYSYGGRADARIAQVYVAQLMEAQGGWYSKSDLNANISDVNGSSGLLRVLPYAQPDLELSVQAVLAAPELVDPACIAGVEDSYSFSNYIGTKSILYLAKALSGEAVDIEEITALLASGQEQDYVDKMYLVMALYAAGEESGAQEYYESLVKEKLKEITGLSGEVVCFVPADSPSRTQSECTAAASMLATMLQTPEAGGLVRYLGEKGSINEPYLFQKMYYLTSTELSGGAGGSFRYTNSGQNTSVNLAGGTMKSLSFTKEQLAAANFTVLSGTIYADVYYTGAPDTANKENQRIGFTKTVEPVGSGYRVGELVKVTLTPDFGDLDPSLASQLLVIDDYICSGMRFEKLSQGGYSYDSPGWYMNRREGQRLQFTYYGAFAGVRSKPIVYYVRIATPGEYVVESAYISCVYADSWGMTERKTITVKH